MPAIYEHQLVVTDNDLDVLGHVNNLVYLKWMQDAAVAHSAVQGWSTAKYLELGAGWVVRSHTIEYRRPAFTCDQVIVRTWVSDFKKIRSLRKYQILRPIDATVLAVAVTDWAFIGFEHWVPRRVPKEITDSFQLVESSEEPPLPRPGRRSTPGGNKDN